MGFESAYTKTRLPKGNDLAFVFSGSDVMIKDKEIPVIDDISSVLSVHGMSIYDSGQFLGTIDDKACYLFDMPGDVKILNNELSFKFVFLRHYIGELQKDINAAASYASHLLHWHKHSLYCGHCGVKNIWFDRECAKRCPSCGNTQYPKISPAVIIRVHKDDAILLGHNKNFPEGRYSLLAGFMEIGETIEETARREVREEVGIEIENVQYISSQSWPFPDSLMIGLTADYKSGDLEPDGLEIVHADWYTPDTYPSIPGHGTIARKIIDEYTKSYKS